MGVIAWIVVGLIAGALAKMVVPGREPSGIFATMAIGIVGGILGGWLSSFFMGGGGPTGINIGSIVVSFVGSVVLLICYHAVTGRRSV